MAEQTSQYYLITRKVQDDQTVEFKVKHLAFDTNLEMKDMKCDIKNEIKLGIDSQSYDLKNKEIADFKVCEKKNQVRLVLKHVEQPEFECFCFDFETGCQISYIPFNKDTAIVNGQSEQDPIAWVWLADSDDLILKDRRDVKFEAPQQLPLTRPGEVPKYVEDYKKLKEYNNFLVKQDGQRSEFFERLSDLEAVKESEKSSAISFYENEIRMSIHDASAT